MLSWLKKIFGSAQSRQIKRYFKIAKEIGRLEEDLQKLPDEAVRAKTDEFKTRYKEGESLESLLPEAYAVVKNVCRRMLGSEVHVSGYEQKWDMVPFDCQIVGAIAMHNRAIAEMQTGEGKTLTAVMPLYLNALTGKPVHLVTVNDYLAERDCVWVGSVLRWLGITTAALTNKVPPQSRSEVYAADVVYGTASEFGFDYLRDNSMVQRKEDMVQRGYYFAIVDEIDSILIDEARTPLIISGPVTSSRQMYDDLKMGVASLVRSQGELCSRLANEARKVLERFGYSRDESPEKQPKDKDDQELLRGAFHKLWLVSKGTPRNKVLKRMMENPDIRASIDDWDLFYYEDPNKKEKIKALSELFITVDEKASEFELTDKGIEAWAKTGEKASTEDFVMLDLAHEYLKVDQEAALSDEEKLQKKSGIQEEDANRKERAHNLRQMLRAHLLMERDVEYIIQDDKIIIIDENTGRPQPGRRFSDGLHQAIEAKEGVKIQKETQTYATITLQNYFRMYDRLAGMSGTAVTEAGEFKEIYELEVLEIPTHRPNQRSDLNDEIYMTEREKYGAIVQSIKDIHGEGRPILVGTESVEISEKLSRILKQAGVPHTVLNAKNHESEAAIIAEAGSRGAVTIATNMAGRGTDIKLGEGVAGLGGLHVLGTTRQSARRIDRQLRGRCARLGDPGTSQFYLSFEDQLMRFFAGGGVTKLLQRWRPPEGEPISASIVNRSIETAQKRVEQRNYTIRKHTLEYDDVMNKQRQEIYAYRTELLTTDKAFEVAEDLLAEVCEDQATLFQGVEHFDGEGYRRSLMSVFPVALDEAAFKGDYVDAEKLVDMATKEVLEAFRMKIQAESSKLEFPEGREGIEHPIAGAVRSLMLQQVDRLWQEHLLTMDHLRAEVGLRTFAQKDPLIEFKHEAFRLFHDLSHKLRREIGSKLFKFRIVPYDEHQLSQMLAQMRMERERSFVEASGTTRLSPAPGTTQPPKQGKK